MSQLEFDYKQRSQTNAYRRWYDNITWNSDKERTSKQQVENPEPKLVGDSTNLRGNIGQAG